MPISTSHLFLCFECMVKNCVAAMWRFFDWNASALRAHFLFLDENNISKKEKSMGNKHKYERPEITLLQWTIEDEIIRVSGGGGGDIGDWDTDM